MSSHSAAHLHYLLSFAASAAYFQVKNAVAKPSLPSTVLLQLGSNSSEETRLGLPRAKVPASSQAALKEWSYQNLLFDPILNEKLYDVNSIWEICMCSSSVYSPSVWVLSCHELQDPLAMLQRVMTFDEFGLAPRDRVNLHQEGTKKVNKVNKVNKVKKCKRYIKEELPTWNFGTPSVESTSGSIPMAGVKGSRANRQGKKWKKEKTPSVPLQCPRCFPPCDTAVEAPLRVDCTHLRHS